MAKRFTDTNIWDKAWFRKLEPRLKEAWRYLCEKCDNAGIWEIDIEAMAFNIGEPVSLKEITENFDVENYGEKLFIKGFIEFQYNCSPDKLNPENNAHKSAIDKLKRLGPHKPLISPSLGALDMEEDKDKEKEMDKDKEKEKESEKLPRLAILWNEHCGKLPKVRVSNSMRDKKSKALINLHGEESWVAAIERLSQSEFANGLNETGWVADFEFLIQTTTYAKIIEGKYDNRKALSQKQITQVKKMNELKEWIEDDSDGGVREF